MLEIVTLNFFLQIKDQATSGFQAFIVHYRDDPDQQNLIDWIQERWVSSRSIRPDHILI